MHRSTSRPVSLERDPLDGPTVRLVSQRTPVQGLRLHARTSPEAPHPGAPTAVLVHGLVVSGRYLVPLAERLAPHARVYVPDLPGCVATGKTLDEVKRRMSEAVELHLRGMREDGLPIPEPTSLADYVEAA